MARDLTRTKPEISDTDTAHPGGMEEFAPRRERATKDTVVPVSPGWSSDKKPAEYKGGERPDRLSVPDDGSEVLIKFLDDGPFASFWQHWVAQPAGRRAYVCLDRGCPLCDYSDTPKPQDWFNVVEMDDEGNHSLKVWYCSADPSKAVKARSDTKRTSPINKPDLYFALSKKKGANGFNSYSVDPVKSETLQEDWGVLPLTDEQVAKFRDSEYDSSLVRVPSKSDLLQVAEEYFKD